MLPCSVMIVFCFCIKAFSTLITGIAEHDSLPEVSPCGKTFHKVCSRTFGPEDPFSHIEAAHWGLGNFDLKENNEINKQKKRYSD